MPEKRFLQVLTRLHMTDLPWDSASDRGLRFQIGGEEPIYLADHRRPNGAYIEHAVDRALEVYAHLPQAPDVLRIDGCDGLPFLPPPHSRTGSSCYWAIGPEPEFLRKLFREIVRAELDPMGLEELTGNVYFANTEAAVLFQLYDDRWARAAAAEEKTLEELTQACSPWLMAGQLPFSSQITFLNVRDYEAGRRFAAQVLGLETACDIGWATVYAVSDGAFLGIVDHSSGEALPRRDGLLISLTTRQIEAWHRRIAASVAVSPIREIPSAGLRSFFFTGPEDSRFEIQQFEPEKMRKLFG